MWPKRQQASVAIQSLLMQIALTLSGQERFSKNDTAENSLFTYLDPVESPALGRTLVWRALSARVAVVPKPCISLRLLPVEASYSPLSRANSASCATTKRE